MRHPIPVVYQAQFSDGSPVHIRPELCETRAHHADMLRYDLGFHSPTDTALVIFPMFRHKKEGTYPENLTYSRWRSFGVKLQAVKDVDALDKDDWVTYQHPHNDQGQTDYGTLAPMTLHEWLKLHPRVSICGWK